MISANAVFASVVILAGGLSTRMGRAKALLTLPTGETLLDYHVHHALDLGIPIFIADNQQGFAINSQIAKRAATQAVSVSYVSDYQPKLPDLKAGFSAKPKHSAGPLGAILAAMREVNDDKCAYFQQQTTISQTTYPEWLLVVSCDSLLTASDIVPRLFAKAERLRPSEIPSSQIANSSIFNSSIDNSIEISNDKNNDKNKENSEQGCQSAMSRKLKHSESQVITLRDGQRNYPLLGAYKVALAPELTAYLDRGERRVMGFIDSKNLSIAMPEDWITLANINDPESFRRACQFYDAAL